MSARSDGIPLRVLGSLAAVAVAVLLVPPLGIFIAAVVLAKLVAQREWQTVYTLLGVIAVAGTMVLSRDGLQFSFSQAIFTLLTSVALGVPPGLGVLYGWSYGRIVAICTTCLFCINAWISPQANAIVRLMHEDVIKTLEGPEAAELDEVQRRTLMVNEWFLQNWNYFAFGAAFCGALVMSCIAVSAARWRLRKAGLKGASDGGFRSLRPPEWMVWPVIVTAVLVYVDLQSPSEAVRTLSWSGAVGLITVYTLDGIAILAYIVHAFRPNIFLVFTMVFILIVFQLVTMLPLIGLFDTWGEFRRKIDTVLAARKLGDDPRDDGAA